MNKIKILIPVYNDWESLFKLLDKINKEIQNIEKVEFHCTVVNDASTIEPPEIKVPKNIRTLEIINMKKNRGHARCNAFALRHLSKVGDFEHLIVMDGDGEDRPEEIKMLVEKALSNKEMSVVAKRIKRSEGLVFQMLYQIHKIITIIFTGKNVNFGNKLVNLTSLLNGASIIGCNNEHFGRAENILAPGVGKNMGDGWETRRSRGKNFDWLIIKLGRTGIINKIEIDTHHFKGNYPDRCSIQAAYIPKKISNNSVVKKSIKWKSILNKVKLNANKKHSFNNKLMKKNKINYIRINIYPDGGISRIRTFGKVIK